MEAFSAGHFVYCSMQSIHNGRCQWLGHIADAETDHFLIGMCLLILADLSCDRGKQIASGQFQKILIDFIHRFPLSITRFKRS